ncbi:MAG: hypothetical protein A3H59_02750 [Candidatus Jacksonbacteria bacterium RIFCSPLOWO2_02_FULL_43_9]|nr:MAG: hypothetical protein UV70_C0011G0038 [Parcubacteria group bacterium GW2011_GWA2_43_13]OGY69313.1 MAG: hypothetical protein A3B94_02990 [Candidatus Jacksonbacteria bacterium RIFCSPHIGHO2_02_FULL_43_10]OGY71482.1 MAG: hypothetical protein A2986_04050 [Candidatus Jacksonbacteria bacterium RIFCSPLOWO2_01_FULL_44_13]OGY71927.1 MAG: hypothetical protein A3H59_02750 [Candidatus Jacksonbacteria bacterium RIFCSPLOWO2_02_FULL_43_9]HAZ16531.1 hypothetical protein [Candidatus Jacksonbacteria bacter
MKNPPRHGFTLVELLVVISIIALLSSLATASFNSARKKARNAKRMSDLKTISLALELYYDTNNAYPITGVNTFRSECAAWGSYTPANVALGLVPTYIATFPSDPKMIITANTSCYLYRSDTGTAYKIIDYIISEFSSADYLSQRQLVDPGRDGGTNNSIVDGTAPTAWAIYSSGGEAY